MTDDQIDDLLNALDVIARDFNVDSFGLPTLDDPEEAETDRPILKLRDAVRVWLDRQQVQQVQQDPVTGA